MSLSPQNCEIKINHHFSTISFLIFKIDPLYICKILSELVFGDRVLFESLEFTGTHTCLCLLSANIKGMCHYTHAELFLYFIRKPLKINQHKD